MRFSRRTPPDISENSMTRALRARAAPPVDLTVSNPTAAGLSPTEAELADALSAPGQAAYRPDPKGIRLAREAVSRHYAALGAPVDPDRIVLTASTSEAYSHLFKLLADPGEAMLTPVPSYPLFEHLIRLEGLAEVPYRLRFSDAESRWAIDLATVEQGLDDGARAILSVHPNNPTGNFVREDERRETLARLEPGGQALISDEVFFDYPVEAAAGSAGVAAAAREGPLAFSLGGLSKSCCLPQMKIAWIAAGGDAAVVREAIERLDLIADTYLSVSTPMQRALPDLFRIGAAAAERTRHRLRRNLAALDRALESLPGAGRYPVEGGWSAVVRFLPPENGEDLALFLLEAVGVLVQPGWFFDFGREDVVVLSLIVDPSDFDEGLARIVFGLGARRT
jgi:alanine-synthesizing transaminase